MCKMMLLLSMQPYRLTNSRAKRGLKCHIPGNLSVGLNFLDYEFKKIYFQVIFIRFESHEIKVACKVAKSFLTLFPVTLVIVEVQESN